MKKAFFVLSLAVNIFFAGKYLTKVGSENHTKIEKEFSKKISHCANVSDVPFRAQKVTVDSNYQIHFWWITDESAAYVGKSHTLAFTELK